MSGPRGWRNLSNCQEHPRHLEPSQRSTNQPFYNPSLQQYHWSSQHNLWTDQNYNNFNYVSAYQMRPQNRMGAPVSQEHNYVPKGKGGNNYQQSHPRFQNPYTFPVNQTNYSPLGNHGNKSLEHCMNRHQRHSSPNQGKGVKHSHIPPKTDGVNELYKPGPLPTRNMPSNSEASDTPLTPSDISLVNKVKSSLKLYQARQGTPPDSTNKGKTATNESAKSIPSPVPTHNSPSRTRTRSSSSNTDANMLLQGIGFIDKHSEPAATNPVNKTHCSLLLFHFLVFFCHCKDFIKF